MVHSAVALLETIFGGGAVTGNIMPVHYKSVKHILCVCATFLIIHIIKDIDTDNLKYAHIPKTRSNVVQQIQTPPIYISFWNERCVFVSSITECNEQHFHSWIFQWVLGRNWNYDPLSMHAAVLTQFFCLIHRSQASSCLRSSFLRSRKRSDPSCRSSRQSPAVLPNSLTFWSDAFILHWLLSHFQHDFLSVLFHYASEPLIYLLFWFIFFLLFDQVFL